MENEKREGATTTAKKQNTGVLPHSTSLRVRMTNVS
jgi:hypothetical protein